VFSVFPFFLVTVQSLQITIETDLNEPIRMTVLIVCNITITLVWKMLT